METIWLIVWLVTSDGGHVKLADDKQPDMATCWIAAAEAHNTYFGRLKDVDEDWELNVSCATQHEHRDPA